MAPRAPQHALTGTRAGQRGRQTARFAVLGVALAAAGWVYEAFLHFALSGGRESFTSMLIESPDVHDLYERVGFLFLVVTTGFTVAWMAGRRRQAEVALRGSEERYRLLVDHAPVGIAVYVGGRTVFVNAAAKLMFGVNDPAEYIGRNVLEFVHPDYQGIVKERMREMAQTGLPAAPLEERLVRPDGTAIDVEMVAVPTVFDGNAATQVVFTDITERRRAQEALQAAHDALDGQRRRMGELARKVIDAQERERQYLATEIHDDFLQGLVATSFFLQSMDLASLDPELGERKRRLEEVVQACIQKGRTLIAEIEPIREPGMRLIPAVQKSIDISLANSGIRTRFNHPDTLNEISLHDDINILRIIQEALMNVRKHARAGKVTVDIVAEPERLVVQIADDGSGFDTDSVSRGPVGRYGLLAMRERASLIGGSLTVESAPGKGTTVRGVFPIVRVSYPN